MHCELISGAHMRMSVNDFYLFSIQGNHPFLLARLIGKLSRLRG
jgi:hypothetical protein